MIFLKSFENLKKEDSHVIRMAKDPSRHDGYLFASSLARYKWPAQQYRSPPTKPDAMVAAFLLVPAPARALGSQTRKEQSNTRASKQANKQKTFVGGLVHREKVPVGREVKTKKTTTFVR